MSSSFDVYERRKEFPCLHQDVYEKPLVYLDNAATAQKPQRVIDAVSNYYEKYCANVHRGVHFLSAQATQKYNETRALCAKFLGAQSSDEIIFTKGTTESINLLAQSLKPFLKEGDEIILSEMEHHANIVPWYFLAQDHGVKLKIIPLQDDGTIRNEDVRNLVSEKTKIISLCHASNSLGTINNIQEIAHIAREASAISIVDGAQAVHHFDVDVTKLDVDFYTFSSHKAYGPTGIGVLYGKGDWFTKLPPYQGGGDMIESVSFDSIQFAKPPTKFEAGTPNIAAVCGLYEALRFIQEVGVTNICEHEKKLHGYALKQLNSLPDVRVFGPTENKVGILSFSIKNIHPHDIASIFDREGVAIRAGHLCTQPVMKRFKVNAFSRASFGIYNTIEELDQFYGALKKVFEVFKR